MNSILNTFSYAKAIVPTQLATSATFDLTNVTDFMLDNRAIGYRAMAIGGRESAFEPMAEAIVAHNLEMDLAARWADETVLQRVFDRLFPKKEKELVRVTSNQGILTMPMIVEAYIEAVSASSVDSAAGRVLANVLAEVTAAALKHLKLILPFDGLVSLSVHTAFFPSNRTLKEAARVKRVTEVLESLSLDPQIGNVKTLSAAALYTALRPVFMRASRTLIATTQQDIEFADSLWILKMYITRDSRLPKYLISNSDLEAMSTNLTLVLCALDEQDREIALEPFQVEPALSKTLLTVREMKRFSLKHLSELKDWFAHYTIMDQPGQRVTGLVFGRNLQLENKPQVTVFNQVGNSQKPLWTQVPYPMAENRVEPLLTHLFNTELNTQGMASAIAGVATYTHDQDTPTVYFVNGSDTTDLRYYAAAVSAGLVVTHDGSFTNCELAYRNVDSELNYDSGSIIVGTRVLSSDPAEAVIHSGLRENAGTGVAPTRTQAIPETCRTQMMWENPDHLTLNLGNPLTLAAKVNGVVLRVDTSLSKLLALPEQLRMSLTKNMVTASVLDSYFETLLRLAEKAPLDSAGSVGRLRAATHLTNVLLAVGASPAGRALLKSVMTKLVAGRSREEQQVLRGSLRQAQLSFKIAVAFGANVLVAMELLSEVHANEALELIQIEDLSRLMIGSMPNLTDLI